MRKAERAGPVQPGEEEAEGGPYRCLQTPQGRVSGGRGLALCGGAQRQDKGPRAQTAAQEVPSEREAELLSLEGGRALAQLPGEAGGSPSLQTFTSRLDVTLCDLLWVTLLWQGRDQMGSRGPFDPDQSVSL